MTTDEFQPTALAREASEAAAAARLQLQRCGPRFAELGARLRTTPPRFVVTCARGSSDHASAYGKYLIETRLGRAVASVGPSVASVYGGPPLQLEGALFVAVSQSGKSPDLLRLTEAARKAGALTVGFVNEERSPLAQACELTLPLCAGPEASVAATKSFLLSGLAFLQLTAHWSGEAKLLEAAAALPDALDRARALDWWSGLQELQSAKSLYVVGRGIGFGVGLELALKLKETCRLHAEAFSAAEVVHGPLALVERGFPVLALVQPDGSESSTRAVISRLVSLGARVWSTLPVPGAQLLPTVEAASAEIQPLCQVQSFYLAVNELARARGLDPDAPAHLRKVTETV